MQPIALRRGCAGCAYRRGEVLALVILVLLHGLEAARLQALVLAPPARHALGCVDVEHTVGVDGVAHLPTEISLHARLEDVKQAKKLGLHRDVVRDVGVEVLERLGQPDAAALQLVDDRCIPAAEGAGHWTAGSRATQQTRLSYLLYMD